MRDLISQDKCDICGGKSSILQIISEQVLCSICFRKKVYGMAHDNIRRKCPFSNFTPCQGHFCGLYSETFGGCGLSLLDKFKIDVSTPKAEVSLKVEKDIVPYELSPQNLLGETRNNQSQIVTLAQELSVMKLAMERIRIENGRKSVETCIKPESGSHMAAGTVKANPGAKKGSKRIFGASGKGKKKKA